MQHSPYPQVAQSVPQAVPMQGMPREAKGLHVQHVPPQPVYVYPQTSHHVHGAPLVQPVYAAPVHIQTAPVVGTPVHEPVQQPIVHGNGYSVVAGGPGPSHSQWVGDTCDCTEDIGTCVYGFCCSPCMFLEVGMDAYDYGGDLKWTCLSDTLISLALNCKFQPCTLVCCPRYGECCFKGHVLGRFRKKYNLPSLKCGRDWHIKSMEGPWCFPDCCQMTFCFPCTLCLMYRQMNAQGNTAMTNEPYIPQQHFGWEPEGFQPIPANSRRPAMN
uniref:Uncharacterized protein n=1 Tax=Lotharella oceanica TaxID=641309 RepID=A0A7S2TND0_9EUKA|eukprot:CAMPEP_0170176264 /NCGR_PEP_ID=MMETSP0040_2-20121228/9185_1 /TAXON_ID=641309 /ORGANISM="Lotharella oceanica, Strain CCMP622" /LENGTH=270 /DNA_ID=CAMNT_0010418535 /DNA_START=51 /DNA_END=863 /DNA_ORIENTATION=+